MKFTRGQEDECRNSTFPSGSYCESVESWEDFALWVNETVPGDELYLCPFSIYKGDQLPVFIEWGLSIICVRSNEIDSCTFRGSGTFINVDTDEFTYFQGFDFKDTNDYAVHVLSTDEDATGVTRTFCYCSFSG